MAAPLRSRGFAPGARIALLRKNCAHFCFAELAIWMAGHATVAILPTETAATVRYVLEHGEAALAQCLQAVHAGLAAHERLHRLVLAREPWSIESGGLTPTLKVERSHIEARVAARVEAWYAAEGPVLGAQGRVPASLGCRRLAATPARSPSPHERCTGSASLRANAASAVNAVNAEDRPAAFIGSSLRWRSSRRLRPVRSTAASPARRLRTSRDRRRTKKNAPAQPGRFALTAALSASRCRGGRPPRAAAS